jgi:hypothetical protein
MRETFFPKSLGESPDPRPMPKARLRVSSKRHTFCRETAKDLETIICSVLAIRFEWTERFFAWTRRWESLEVDELAFVLLALAIGLAWFSARRWSCTTRTGSPHRPRG